MYLSKVIVISYSILTHSPCIQVKTNHYLNTNVKTHIDLMISIIQPPEELLDNRGK